MMHRTLRLLLFVVICLAFWHADARAEGTLRYGLEFDPAVLDPAIDGSYTGRIVLAAMCDQLIDIDAELNFIPQLATAWEWSDDKRALTLHLRDHVLFQDGELLDAAAVQANIMRYQMAPESQRRAETRPIVGVDVVDPLTVRFRLDQPYAPLLAVLANRPGIMMSPKILRLGKDAIAAKPECAGPFRLTERVAQDRIVLDRFPGYWNATAIKLDRVVFRPVVDPTVRLLDLKSGSLDLINRTSPTDVAAVKADRRLRLVAGPSIGFQLLSFNVAHPPGSDSPLGRDARVREAFEKSIDRGVLNQVVMDSQYIVNNQTEPPGTRYWDPGHPVPPRDVEGAKALLKAAGVPNVSFTLMVANDPVSGQIAQVMQSMAADAGIDLKIRQVESNAGLAAELAGDYQVSMVIWSGRPDPDQNSSIWASCDGFLNWGRYCNKDLDALFARGTQTVDPDQRVAIYRRIDDIMQRDHSHMVLYNFRWLWSMSDRLDGFKPMPDGVVRMTGLSLKP